MVMIKKLDMLVLARMWRNWDPHTAGGDVK